VLPLPLLLEAVIKGEEVIEGEAVIEGEEVIEGEAVIEGEEVIDGEEVIEGTEAVINGVDLLADKLPVPLTIIGIGFELIVGADAITGELLILFVYDPTVFDLAKVLYTILAAKIGFVEIS